MKPSKLCYGFVITQESAHTYRADSPQIWREAGKHSLHYYEAQAGIRPTDVTRIRMKCPVCGRRMLSSVRTCHDGCCIIHVLPPHKPKGWWKKKIKKHKREQHRFGSKRQ